MALTMGVDTCGRTFDAAVGGGHGRWTLAVDTGAGGHEGGHKQWTQVVDTNSGHRWWTLAVDEEVEAGLVVVVVFVVGGLFAISPGFVGSFVGFGGAVTDDLASGSCVGEGRDGTSAHGFFTWVKVGQSGLWLTAE